MVRSFSLAFITMLALSIPACSKRNFNADADKNRKKSTLNAPPAPGGQGSNSVSTFPSKVVVRLVNTTELNEKTVTLYDTYGWRISPTSVRVNLRAWVHEGQESPVLRGLFQFGLAAYIGDANAATTTPEANAIFAERSRPFFYNSLPGKSPDLLIGQKSFKLAAAGENGLIEQTTETDLPIPTSANDPSTITGTSLTEATVFVLDNEGTSVISDIDETIKETGVAVQSTMLLNTFYKPLTPVSGMVEAFQKLQTAGCAFHYVSNSPWHLYPGLRSFIRISGFPGGSFHLAPFRLSDRSSIQYLFGRDEIKTANIETLLSNFPARKFILVGDTAENDPEIYTAIAKRRPNMITKIFLRTAPSATTHPADRITKLCAELSANTCKEFSNPAEIQL